MWHCAVIVLVLLEALEISYAIPPYLKPCSKTKDFKACALKNGNEAIPFLLKGDPDVNVPNLLPLKFATLEIPSGPNLNIKLSKVELFGVETATLTNFEMDFDKQTVLLGIDAERLSILAQYEIAGRILVLPIEGKGPVNITAVDSKFEYTFSFKLEKRGSEEYIIIQDNDKLAYKIGKIHFHLDNLFNGNKLMGDNVNKFLNENDQDVLTELGGVIDATIRSIVKKVGGNVLAALPYHDIFLD